MHAILGSHLSLSGGKDKRKDCQHKGIKDSNNGKDVGPTDATLAN